jgi:hypothetical protein
MDQMVAADGNKVPIAGENDDLHIRAGDMKAEREWNGPPMSRMKGIQLHISRNAAGAPDSRNKGNLIQIEIELLESFGHGCDNRSQSAGRAPNMRDTIHPKDLFHRMCLCDRFINFYAHFTASFIVL